jgi:hypothetical protein
MGHIPGPYLDPANGKDFSDGIVDYPTNPNFSNAYADLRHMPGLLIENHSLKPYKQRVLGTYVLMEETMKVIGEQSVSLKSAIIKDRSLWRTTIPIEWEDAKTSSPAKDSLLHLGMKSLREISTLTGKEIVRWLPEKETKKLPFYPVGKVVDSVTRPKGYWIPLAYSEVLNKLKLHGVQVDYLYYEAPFPDSVTVTQYRIRNHKFILTPFEGRLMVDGKPEPEKKVLYPAKKFAFVSTDQPLGDLAILLLEPACQQSLLRWGFFNTIFQKTEYAEAYFLEPMARQMLKDSPSLRAEFEEKKKEDLKSNKKDANILDWFYQKSPYFDPYYQVYPVLRQEKD